MSNEIMLNKDCIQLHSMSSSGRTYLFWYEGRLFRSPCSSEASNFYKIVNGGCPYIQQTKPTAYKLITNGLDEYNTIESVFEHTVFEHQVRIQESTPERAKDFISIICKINAHFVKQGLILKDIHEGNICDTIYGIKWLDFDAFEDCVGEYPAVSFVMVSYLIHKYLFKTIHCDNEHICLQDVINLGGPLASFAHKDFTSETTWRMLEQYVSEINVATQDSHWSDNYSNMMDINSPHLLGTKGINVDSLLNEIDFKTATDVACNKGYYGFLAAKKAKSVIAFDITEACIVRANEFNKEFRLPIIFGVKNLLDIQNNLSYDIGRYKSDLVMALAIVHHIGNIISVENFAKLLSAISNKYILIEDIDNAHGYELEFVKNGFKLLKRVDSTPQPRTLSLYVRE